MSDRPEYDAPMDGEPTLPGREVLDAWQIPDPAPGLAERVLDHVDTVVTMMPEASMTTTTPMRSNPGRGALGMAMVGIATLAAAALVMGLVQWWRGSPPPAEPPPTAAVSGQAAVAPEASPSVSASLVVRTEPADARVWVDGMPVVGPSPFTVSRLSAGSHRIKVERDGYLPVERVIEGGSTVDMPIELPLREVVLVVSVDPFDAAVQLLSNGEPVDIGSDGDRHVLQRELGVRYEVEASAPGYLTRRVPLALGSEADVPVTLSLVPDPAAPAGTVRSPDLADPFTRRSKSTSMRRPSSGGSSPELKDPFATRAHKESVDKATLRVGTASGRGPAKIYIDGRYRGMTPILNIKLDPGVHSIKATWIDGASWTRRLSLSSGETKTVKVE